MVKTKLVDALILDGEKILRELDRQNFPVESMFWIELPEQGYWRLIIATDLVADRGTGDAYHRLDEILHGLDLAGIDLADISVVDPHSQEFQSLRATASSSSRLAVDRSWVQFDEAVVYRWNDALVRGILNCGGITESEFNQFWNSERKLGNQPRRLIDLGGQRLTLRFHPGHYGLTGIESIKQAFQIALHRPEARPDCQIEWLN
ncbi:MAG: hypothetical protein ACRD4O_07770 [Bryobacteraceae bacterium]